MGAGAGRPSDDLKWAKNVAKFMVKRVKSEVEKRRWFDRFLVLSKLATIELREDPPPNIPAKDPLELKLPDLDSQAAEMLKKIQNGGDDGVPNGKP
jgi:hypothetical protein